MSNPIAIEARKALTASGFPTAKGMCQKFARLVVQATEVGHKYDDDFQKSSAKEAAEAMLSAHPGFVFRFTPGMIIQPGDLLYKVVGSGGFGHVGIFLGNNQVAENSTYQWNKSGGGDARGIRTLEEFGAFQVVVRFPIAAQAQPAPAKPDIFLINNRIIQGAELKDGKLFAPIVNVLDAVGFEVDKVNDRRADRGRMDIRAVPVK